MSDLNDPRLIAGDVAVDDRGELRFCNELDMTAIKRFYLVSNHTHGRVRAWHAHRRETKYLWPVAGAVVVGVVKIDNWEQPSKVQKVERFVLSAHRPMLLAVPPGHANGFMSLTDDAQLLIFSDRTLGESQGDDVRFDSRYWDVWQVVDR